MVISRYFTVPSNRFEGRGSPTVVPRSMEYKPSTTATERESVH
jgi:hypothetical protein